MRAIIVNTLVFLINDLKWQIEAFKALRASVDVFMADFITNKLTLFVENYVEIHYLFIIHINYNI